MMQHFSLLFGNFLGRKFPTAPPIKGRVSVWPDSSRQLFLSRWRSTQLTSDTTATHLVNLELIERAEPSQTPFLLRHKSLSAIYKPLLYCVRFKKKPVGTASIYIYVHVADASA